MLTGFLCLILLLLLSTTSRQKARSALGRSAIGFRGPHLIASVLLLPLLSLHIAGAGLGLQQSWKSVLWAAVAALAIAGLLRRPHHGTDPF